MHTSDKAKSKREPNENGLREFSEAVADARSRLAIPAPAEATLPSRHIWASLDLASSELINAMEELNVAEEELRQQHEELLDSRLALEEERARFLELFELAPDAYLVTDADGMILQANGAAGVLFGVSAARLVGKPFPIFVAEPARPMVRARLLKLATDRSITNWLVTISPRDKGEIIVSTSATSVLDASGKVTGYRWILRDVSEQVRLRHQLARLNDELEEKVAARTAELRAVNEYNEELLVREREARTQAERANRVKSDFFAVMSHEFRTPLQAIFGYTELLEREIHGPLSQEQLHDLERIRQNQQHLLGLINGILDFAKLDSGHESELNIIRLPVAEVLAPLDGLVAPQLAAKNISLGITIPQNDISAYGDWARVQQILLNLLSNAIKFTPPQGEVTISCQANGDSAHIIVSDTGCGIPQNMLEEVFEPFVQIRQGNILAEGTGLGLAISRNLARSMDGDILVESRTRQGSVFTLELPARRPGLQ